MPIYILKRLLLMIPTLFGIMLINFLVAQVAPGGPIQQIIAKVRGGGGGAESHLGGGAGDFAGGATHGTLEGESYRGMQGIDPEFIKELEQHFGFDKPLYERFWVMIKNYATFDFGESYFKGKRVVDLIMDKLPVSISLGIWTTLIVYLISIPLGIRKAVRDGTRFDIWTSFVVITCYAIPSFLFALFLIILFAGGSFMQIFPLKGLHSDYWDQLTLLGKIVDYLWHMILPITAMVIAGFAKLTLLTKNSFLEELNKQYVLCARAKGITEKAVLYGHIFRNAMLIVIASFPAVFITLLFTSSLLIEFLFSLDGLGLLGFDAALSRDYPVMFGVLYMFTLLGMILHLIGDLTYMFVDPRIDIAAKKEG